ncbi:hypothetical protein GYMLUDRAFT_63911 [Collybiopsis luxurians FD-317 M1]|uniref:Uncharacterized protein n=1 Tax=Collybiopsis luxurians FD-317 M1 TaxID=944289 RepID=A0A0D0BEL8_9AGAR|nr:hypothetical protein GYMLUDRAFT_63911 [Collybiopsis luxurians FD-317 M1]
MPTAFPPGVSTRLEDGDIEKAGFAWMDLAAVGGTATSSSSAIANVEDDTVSVLQWHNGVELATMRKRKGNNARSIITRSTSLSSGTAQLNLHPSVSSHPPFSPVMPMNMHILTDTETKTNVETDTEADESSSSPAASTTLLYYPNLPTPSSRSQPKSATNPTTYTNSNVNPSVDNRLSSSSSFDDLNNLPMPRSNNLFADPGLPRVQAQTFSSFLPPPPSSSIHSLSLIPSLSVSHPVPRVDIEDNGELIMFPRRLLGCVGVSPSDVLSSEFSYLKSSLEGGQIRMGGEFVGLSWPTMESTAPGKTALVEDSMTGARSSFGAGSVGARRPLQTGYLTWEHIQHLIDVSESQSLAQSGSGSQSHSRLSASATTTTGSASPDRATGASGSGSGTGTAASSVYAFFTASPNPDPISSSFPTASSPPLSPTTSGSGASSSSRRYFSPFASVSNSPAVEPTLPRRMGIIASDSEEFNVRSVSESVSVSDIEEAEGLGQG